MPQLKELSLYFTASSHRSRRHLSGGAAHPYTQLATLHGGEPVGPRRVGCRGVIFQACDVPPGFPHSRRRNQSVWPLLTTVGVNLHPTLPLTARDGAENECTSRNLRFCNKQYLCTLTWSSKWNFTKRTINSVILDSYATSDLSIDINYNISVTLFKLKITVKISKFWWFWHVNTRDINYWRHA